MWVFPHPYLSEKCISNCLNIHMKFRNVLNYLDTPQTGYEPTTLSFVSIRIRSADGIRTHDLGDSKFNFIHSLSAGIYIKLRVKLRVP